MEERFQIKTITDEIWPAVKQLIHDGWNENHVFTKSDDLLRWHYSGFGEFKNKGAFTIYDEDKLIGFRLMIPIEITLSSPSSKRNIQSAVSTLYFILPEYRGMKLGLKMQLYVMDKWNSFFAIASNLDTSAPIYRKSGAYMLDEMYRWALPLTHSYKNLMVNPEGKFEIANLGLDGEGISPVDINPENLESIWNESTDGINVTSLTRNRGFWSWRYKESPVYKYVCFGGWADGGVIIGRVCYLYNEDMTMKNERVFRILEFIPINKNVWNGEYDDNMKKLLAKVSQWAKTHNCCLVEFYTTTNHFNSIFESLGFKEINIDGKNKSLDSFSYFEPCSPGKRLSNVTLYAKEYDGEFYFNNSYFTLSDADQDRPNTI